MMRHFAYSVLVQQQQPKNLVSQQKNMARTVSRVDFELAKTRAHTLNVLKNSCKVKIYVGVGTPEQVKLSSTTLH